MADDAIKTVVGEIMRIAVEHGYEGTQIKTIAGAIDALADTLAGSDVDSGSTVAQAVRALAPYIGSGGGGVELGALQNGIRITTTIPAVGDYDGSSGVNIESAKAGNIVVFGSDSENVANVPSIAAGLVVTIADYSYNQSPDASAYVVTTEPDETEPGDFVYASVRQWDGQLDVNVGEQDPETETYNLTVTLTVPELDVDSRETLIIFVDRN